MVGPQIGGGGLGPARRRLFKNTMVGAPADAFYVLTQAHGALPNAKVHDNSGAPNYDILHPKLDDGSSTVTLSNDGTDQFLQTSLSGGDLGFLDDLDVELIRIVSSSDVGNGGLAVNRHAHIGRGTSFSGTVPNNLRILSVAEKTSDTDWTVGFYLAPILDSDLSSGSRNIAQYGVIFSTGLEPQNQLITMHGIPYGGTVTGAALATGAAGLIGFDVSGNITLPAGSPDWTQFIGINVGTNTLSGGATYTKGYGIKVTPPTATTSWAIYTLGDVQLNSSAVLYWGRVIGGAKGNVWLRGDAATPANLILGTNGADQFQFSSTQVLPLNDNTVDVGGTSNRFKTIHATQLRNASGNLLIDVPSGSELLLRINALNIFRITDTIGIVSAASITPALDSTYNIGSNAVRFAYGYFDTLDASVAITAPYMAADDFFRGGPETAGAPTFSFIADSNTGMYRSNVDQLAFSTAGVKRFHVDVSSLSASVTIESSLDVKGRQLVAAGDNAGIASTVSITNVAPALGGGAAATLGTIGGTGPAAAAQTGWIKMYVGATPVFVPYWT